METRNFILATAGHVDHGKSALVRGLTGIDPDRLPEEKARGMTIELGFAHLRIGSPPGAADEATYQLGIVDVPGHEDFVKNMVAGVGSIDAALLVVAADDGWMPQTEEHVQILGYLGVLRAVVALTKADLVPTPDLSIAAVRERLAGSALAGAAVVPTSVVTGAGLAELRGALAEMFAGTPVPRDIGKPRLPVDRVFSLKGVGTVVTGTLSGGALRRGQGVVIQASGLRGRVRNLQMHNRDVEEARPGSRVAINLPDVEPRAGRGLGEAVVGRGDVITIEGLGGASRALDVALERSGRSAGNAAPRPLKDGAVVQVHHGSGVSAARVHLLDAGHVEAGGAALAHLRLRAPLFAFAGDRFVVRDWPEQHTLAGGVVLDPEAGDGRDAGRGAFLKARAAAPEDPLVFVASHVERFGAARRDALLLRSRFSREEVTGACDQLVASGRGVGAGDWVVRAEWWDQLRARAVAAIDAWHGAHPERAGMSLSDLMALLSREERAEPELLRALVEGVCRDGFVRAGVAIRRVGFRPRLPARLAGSGERLRRILSERPFDPPSRRELEPDDLAHQALKFLVLSGEAVELGAEQVLGAEAFGRAVEVIREQLRRRGAATVAELKTALGSSRRVVVPLLERLDRDGVTRREGDRRVLRQ